MVLVVVTISHLFSLQLLLMLLNEPNGRTHFNFIEII